MNTIRAYNWREKTCQTMNYNFYGILIYDENTNFQFLDPNNTVIFTIL